ncbi:MAG: hypothetical protein JNM59_08465 [Hyphomonadaceae bacterium]|nr:hypothetical protein [Hyphomonadaceae bacterium]
MRIVLIVCAAFFLAQCASGGDDRFRVSHSPDALVIVGIAETSDNRDPRYSLLWRKLDEAGAFADYDDARSINARTHSDTSLRLRGIPGEFDFHRVPPGTYALDSAYATLQENGVTYTAQGLVQGPDRPSFEVRAGEAIYIGIWEMDIDGAEAVTRLWRLSDDDLVAIERAAGRRLVGAPQLRAVEVRQVPCRPRRMAAVGARQVC